MEPVIPGLAPAPAVLLEERGRPDFRDVFGALARRSTAIRTAVTRVRLTTVDLRSEELANLERMRVVVSEMNALQLDAEARALVHQPRRAGNVEFWKTLLETGVLEVRSAPLGGWAPDFTVFGNAAGPTAVLAGFHAFERPYPHRGPALASLHGPEGARLAERRHRELWDGAHDIGSVLWNLLSRAQRTASVLVAGG
jgi:hypothetical protein